jgi:hypothetical protein
LFIGTHIDVLENIASKFKYKWQFCICIGAIDVKHIAIRAPINRDFFSFLFQQATFITIGVGSMGR